MRLPITVDPRFYDAVLFDLGGAPADNAAFLAATGELARSLQATGVLQE